MIRPLARLALVLSVAIPLLAWADTYRLRNGDLVDGEPISFDARGVVFKTPAQQFTPRVGWTNMTDEALKKLAQIPEAQQYTDDYIIEDDEADEEEAAQLEIRPREHPKLERLPAQGGISALFSSPLSLSLLLLVYVGNLYAGFEISIFRNYPVWVGCVLAAVLPFVGPIVLLCLPTRLETAPELAYDLPPEQYLPPEEAGDMPAEAGAPQPAMAAPVQAPAAPAVTVYQRGTTTFNRRFFETKLAGFMKVVPSEEEKDLVVQIKSARGDYVGSRISRVMPNEVIIQINKGGATADVEIPFAEVKEVKVCHKDALGKA